MIHIGKWKRPFKAKHNWSAVPHRMLGVILRRHCATLVRHPYAKPETRWSVTLADSERVGPFKKSRTALIAALEKLGEAP